MQEFLCSFAKYLFPIVFFSFMREHLYVEVRLIVIAILINPGICHETIS